MIANSKRAAILREQLMTYGAPRCCVVCGATANRWARRWYNQDDSGYDYWRFAEKRDGVWVVWNDNDDMHDTDQKPFWVGPLVNNRCQRCQYIQTQAERAELVFSRDLAALAAWNAGEPRRVG